MYDLIETFRFDYEYNFIETFRSDYEYEFDCKTSKRPLDLTTSRSLTTSTTS